MNDDRFKASNVEVPEQILQFRVLLSSPSDLKEERDIVEDVIRELNQTWGGPNSTRVELLRWEDIPPGFASEPQGVINKGLGDSWDIYLGLMGTRFGTPTHEHGSGTEEEFKRAYKLWQGDKDRRRLMFFFKTAPVSPTEIDPEQLQKVKDFQDEIGTLGGLHKPFASTNGFAGFIRVGLGKCLNELLEKFRGETPQTSSPPAAAGIPSSELGILDNQEVMLRESEKLAMLMGDYNKILNELGQSLSEHGKKFRDAVSNRNFELQKKSIKIMATVIPPAVKRLEPIRTEYKSSITTFTDAISRLLAQSTASADEKKNVKEILAQVISQMENVWNVNSAAQKDMIEVPNISRDFTNSKEMLRSEFKAYNLQIHNAIGLFKELLHLMD